MNDIIRPLHRLTHALPYIFDPKMGVISNISEHPREADSPRFFRYNAMAANTQAFNSYRNFAVGGGAATTRDMALAKTIGESVERYCAAIYKKDEFPLCSYNEADFKCVDPGAFALYTAEQCAHPKFDFDLFTRDSPIRWAQCVDAKSGEVVYAPAAMIYVPYFFYENDVETPICQPISTGLSSHCSYEEAAIGAICEVVERDAFMITWQAKLSRRRIRLESLSPANADLVSRFEEAGYCINLMDISNETRIPAILAVATSEKTGYVPIVVAASAFLSAEEAVQKALEELAHTERYAYQIKTELSRLPWDEEFDNVLGQVHHVNFWINENVTKEAGFLFQSTDMIDFNELSDFLYPTPKQELDRLVDLIDRSGYQVLITDITTRDIQDLGMHVVRAIIPGYHPLFMGYHNRALGGTRLWNIPQQLGYPGISPDNGDNPYPHPFP